MILAIASAAACSYAERTGVGGNVLMLANQGARQGAGWGGGMESAGQPVVDVLAKIRDAHALMSQALTLLDEAGTPGEADAHLDLAICCVADEIARRSRAAGMPASGDPAPGPWGTAPG